MNSKNQAVKKEKFTAPVPKQRGLHRPFGHLRLGKTQEKITEIEPRENYVPYMDGRIAVGLFDITGQPYCRALFDNSPAIPANQVTLAVAIRGQKGSKSIRKLAFYRVGEFGSPTFQTWYDVGQAEQLFWSPTEKPVATYKKVVLNIMRAALLQVDPGVYVSLPDLQDGADFETAEKLLMDPMGMSQPMTDEKTFSLFFKNLAKDEECKKILPKIEYINMYSANQVSQLLKAGVPKDQVKAARVSSVFYQQLVASTISSGMMTDKRFIEEKWFSIADTLDELMLKFPGGIWPTQETRPENFVKIQARIEDERASLNSALDGQLRFLREKAKVSDGKLKAATRHFNSVREAFNPYVGARIPQAGDCTDIQLYTWTPEDATRKVPGIDPLFALIKDIPAMTVVEGRIPLRFPQEYAEYNDGKTFRAK